jgi:tetratricopeptide (TPR) repeat protein
VLAKARARPLYTVRQRREAPRSTVVLPLLGLVVVAVLAAVSLRRSARPAMPAPGPSAVAASASEPARAELPAPAEPAPPVQVAVPLPATPALTGAAEARDMAEAARLAAKLQARAIVDAEDRRSAERLHGLYPDATRALVEAVLLTAAAQERAARRYDEALALVERALAAAPASLAGRRMRLALRSEQGDWAGAEAAARELLAASPDDGEATRALAYALVRLDRGREAIETLGSYLDRHQDGEASLLLARFRRDAVSESSLGQQTLSHFHVRYDGDAHEDVGREVLRVLERHYATLARTFDREPKAAIPVVLLSARSYYGILGAPAWSGGFYDGFDGRVRVPIGGLTSSLTPELDGTVLHELTHVFVADASAGVAPRELHEGLAQLMEGRRLDSELDAAGLRALADGRLRDPRGFYMRALGLVEDLVAQRGQGGINDVLAVMARSGDADAAFREVYGRELPALQADWAGRFKRQHGS